MNQSDLLVKSSMINFDFLTLKIFLEENIDFLVGARLQKIQQPTRRELIFWLRNKGESKKFYVNIHPQFFHICFMSSENERKRGFEIPKSPPMFCMLLRKYLESSKIAKVSQPEGERILEFYFETYNEIGEKIYLCLAIELMGKHSNVVLYNYDTNVIIGCAHNVGSDKSRERELIGGLPYAYPLKSNSKSFSGLSSILSDGESVNEFIDNYFADLQEKQLFNNLKSKLLTVTKTKLRKVVSSIEKIEKQATTADKAESYRKKGDLIMANLYNNKDFLSSIDVFDYETHSPVKIILDDTKTLKENANQYYKLYNKAKTAFFKTDEMTQNLKIEKENLEQVLYSIEEAGTIEDLFEIDEDAKMQGGKEAKKIKNYASMRLCIYASKNNPAFKLYIGMNSHQNDQIIKLAREEDLWFHVHNCAGSHVLLRVEAGQKVTDEIIFECAKLAKEHSSAKLSSKIGVIYTKAKNLKKPPAAPLGYVIYKNEKEIIVN